MDQKAYSPGQAVTFTLRNYKGALGQGSYSLSVSRIEEVPELPAPSAEGFAAAYSRMRKQIPQEINDTVWVPEQRGELLSGRVLERGTNSPVAGRPVAISLPGKDFQLLSAETNSEGRFYAYLNAPFTGDTGFVELLEGPEGDYAFEVDDLTAWRGSLGEFRSVQIDSAHQEAIIRRSVHNQIENSYYQVKPDTVIALLPEISYFGHFPKSYDLDAYTRFPTLRETLLEVVENVLVRREGGNNYAIRVRVPLQPGQEFTPDVPSLVTVDGIMVPDHGTLLDFNARRIRYIRVVQENLVWGGRSYQGMVAIETLDGDYGDTWNSESGARFGFRRAEPLKNYFRQPQEGADPHVPDFRHQLLWEPKIYLEGDRIPFTFMTSQVPGRYAIDLEGYTTYGKPISLTTTFMVKGE